MEISQSDITPTLAAGQHGFLSALCFSTFCHFKVNLPLQIWISLMFVSPFPGSCCVSTDYQCNTSNKTHQPTIFPPSAVHFICTGWVRVKGKKNDRGVCLNKFVQSYSNDHLKHENVFCFRGQRKTGVSHVSSGRIDPEAKGDFMCLSVIKTKQRINYPDKRDYFCEYI